ncbi:hypothetical protein Hanom_Chr05g00395071 [Helianthus anomalus]
MTFFCIYISPPIFISSLIIKFPSSQIVLKPIVFVNIFLFFFCFVCKNMNKEKPCNTTLRLGIEVEVTREKQLKQSRRELCLDLSLPIHPNIEGSDHEDHDHTIDDEKDDQDSYSSRITDDHEKEEARRSAKRSDFSNNDVYLDNSGGSRKKLKLSIEQITLLEASFNIHSTLNTVCTPSVIKI